MTKFIDKSVSALAVTVMIGGLSLAHPVYAADDSDEAQSGAMHKGGIHRVDERIRELHDKIGVTGTQESKWKTVAKVMRQNEDNIHHLVDARDQREDMNAVDDLRSYEKITAAHEQGLKRLVPAFEKFYNSLTADQKSTADDMFGSYEGRKEDKEGSADKFNNMRPSSGGDNTNGNNMYNGSGGTVNDTGTMANPANTSDQPANKSETK
jgi:hypothetical protein